MEQIIIYIIIAIVIGVIANRSAKSFYWKGRLEGWKACEDMVMGRVKKSSKYNYDEIWKDLIQ